MPKRRLLSFTAPVAGLAVAAIGSVAPRSAWAQGVHWDASLQAGPSLRTPDGLAAAPGGIVAASAHLAVFPLLRAGPYAVAELSAPGGAPSRVLLAGGLRLKLLSPWPGPPLRAYLFTGIGAAWLTAPDLTLPTSSPAQGGFAEVPLGLGLAYRLRRPWELSAEVGARFGFAAGGAYFTDAPAGRGSRGEPFGVFVTVGLTFDG